MQEKQAKERKKLEAEKAAQGPIPASLHAKAKAEEKEKEKEKKQRAKRPRWWLLLSITSLLSLSLSLSLSTLWLWSHRLVSKHWRVGGKFGENDFGDIAPSGFPGL